MFTSEYLTSHPVARRKPCPPRQRLEGCFELSRTARIFTGCPAFHQAHEKDASLRLLQPTSDTSTLYAARFPISRPSVPVTSDAFRRLPSPGLPVHEFRVELRLTAILQLRLPCNLSGVSPDLNLVLRLNRAPRRSGEPRSKALLRVASRLGALSTTRRACSSASDVLLHDCLARPDLSIRSALTTDGPRTRFRLVKDSRFVETRTPSLDECALPCFACSVHRLRGHQIRVAGSSRTRHRTCNANVGGRLRTSFSPFDPREDEPRVNRRASSVRCTSELGNCNRARGLSSTSAIQNSLRAQPQIDRISVQTVDMTHPARAG